MPRVDKHVAYVIEVVAAERHWSRRPEVEAHWLDAMDVKKQIERHCDDIESIQIRHDTKAVCSFCGAKWTEEDAEYNGGCCDKDEELAPPEENNEQSV